MRLWRDEYVQHFTAYAVSRGWTQENASEWAQEDSFEAMAFHWADTTPESAAKLDVPECEMAAHDA